MPQPEPRKPGGSSTSTAVEADNRWSERRLLALLVRLAAFLVPLASSVLLTSVAASLLPRPPGLILTAIRLVVLMMVSVVVFSVVSKQSRRILPLSMLYGMSMVFPDQVPSRFSVAIRTGTAKQLERTLATLTDDDDPPAPAEAAALLLGLVKQLTQHERLTRGHSERVRAYSDLIAEEMGLGEYERDRLHWSAMLHDVGKLVVPAEILRKPGRPSEEEWQHIRAHPGASLQFLGGLEDWLGEWILAASQHHERWDGDGYPLGLAGNDISIAGRIVSVADAYDVMTSARSYKKPLSVEAARQELVKNSGTQFDPAVVRAFLNVGLERTRRAGAAFGLAAELPTVLTSLGSGVAQTASTVAVTTAVVATSVALPLVIADSDPVLAANGEAELMLPGFLDNLNTTLEIVASQRSPDGFDTPTSSAELVTNQRSDPAETAAMTSSELPSPTSLPDASDPDITAQTTASPTSNPPASEPTATTTTSTTTTSPTTTSTTTTTTTSPTTTSTTTTTTTTTSPTTTTTDDDDDGDDDDDDDDDGDDDDDDDEDDD